MPKYDMVANKLTSLKTITDQVSGVDTREASAAKNIEGAYANYTWHHMPLRLMCSSPDASEAAKMQSIQPNLIPSISFRHPLDAVLCWKMF